jgi:hypothetical protein
MLEMCVRTAILVVLTVLPTMLCAEEFDFETPTLEDFTFVRIEFDSVGGWGEAYYASGGRFTH